MLVAPDTTWLLVRTSPSALSTIPVPAAAPLWYLRTVLTSTMPGSTFAVTEEICAELTPDPAAAGAWLPTAAPPRLRCACVDGFVARPARKAAVAITSTRTSPATTAAISPATRRRWGGWCGATGAWGGCGGAGGHCPAAGSAAGASTAVTCEPLNGCVVTCCSVIAAYSFPPGIHRAVPDPAAGPPAACGPEHPAPGRRVRPDRRGAQQVRGTAHSLHAAPCPDDAAGGAQRRCPRGADPRQPSPPDGASDSAPGPGGGVDPGPGRPLAGHRYPPAMATWTPHQLAAILHVARGDRLRALWWLIALRGLRRGEAVAL